MWGLGSGIFKKFPGALRSWKSIEGYWVVGISLARSGLEQLCSGLLAQWGKMSLLCLCFASLQSERSYSGSHQQVALLSFCSLLLDTFSSLWKWRVSVLPAPSPRNSRPGTTASLVRGTCWGLCRNCEDGCRSSPPIHSGLLGLWPPHTLSFSKNGRVVVK